MPVSRARLAATPGAFATSVTSGSVSGGYMFLAVDNSSGSSHGDVYVADEGDGIVTKFTEHGELVPTWGDDGSGESPNGQLVPDKQLESVRGATGTGTLTKGETYISSVTTAPGGEFTRGQEISGPGIPVGTKIQSVEEGGGLLEISQKATASATIALTARAGFGDFSGIAVDPSGNLWVDGEETLEHLHQNRQQVFEFDPEAKFETAWIPYVLAVTMHPAPWGIAVDSGDNIYLNNGIYHETGKLSSSGVFLGIVAGGDSEEVNPATRDETSGVAVDAAGTVYVDSTLSELEAPARELGEGIDAYAGCRPQTVVRAPCSPTEAFAANRPPGGDAQLAVDSASAGDTVYGTSNQGSQRQVLAFSLVTVPGVKSVAPSAVTATSATLQGTVNPSGVPVTECYFEYGLTESYGSKQPCTSLPGSGTSAVAVHSLPIGLEAGKTYHYRLVAANAEDLQEPSLGEDLVFGPPVVGGEWSV